MKFKQSIFILIIFIILDVMNVSCKYKTNAEKLNVKPQLDVTQQILEQKTNIDIITNNDFTIYYPHYDIIDFVCETMPEPTDESIIFCCSAAFTGQLLNEFKHSNIAGHHVSNGTFYKGYACKANTGCFVFNPQDKSWIFAKGNYINYIKEAANNGGMAFAQAMIIHNGASDFKGPVKASSKNRYRALCELKGKLCIIDVNIAIPFQDFVNGLLKMDVTHALYLDMGKGWNYSFYRDNSDKVNYIHNHRIVYTTNWLVFKK